MHKNNILNTVFLLLLLHVNNAFASDIDLQDAWISEAPPSAIILAGYVQIINNSNQPISLIRVSSPVFDKIEIHRSIMKDGMASMEQQDTVSIAAESALDFKPGSYHLMLFKPSQTLLAGDSVSLEFIFSDTHTETIDAEVRRLDAVHDHDQHHH